MSPSAALPPSTICTLAFGVRWSRKNPLLDWPWCLLPTQRLSLGLISAGCLPPHPWGVVIWAQGPGGLTTVVGIPATFPKIQHLGNQSWDSTGMLHQSPGEMVPVSEETAQLLLLDHMKQAQYQVRPSPERTLHEANQTRNLKGHNYKYSNSLLLVLNTC